ncbi:MAG TPA: 7-carboxy-7-deazaguanine synthase QueE [Opitutae bacterium]|nr:7-carboxy-7-deazaguanine synthase QueE [Opitutae bacterium]
MLPIHEQFYTFQGEGVHAGRAAYFIRTFGCPVHCPWCDSAGTWHPDYIPEKIQKYSSEQLKNTVAETAAEFVVITGGEPTIHNLRPLCDALHSIDRPVHLETSGAFPIKGDVDWITLSPKRWKQPLAENVQAASEFKIIVDHLDAIEEYNSMLQELGANLATPIWLHPEWSQHRDQALLDHITEWIKTKGAPYRAGWQMHKNYAADLRDPRSAPAVPLGGKPEQGF